MNKQKRITVAQLRGLTSRLNLLLEQSDEEYRHDEEGLRTTRNVGTFLLSHTDNQVMLNRTTTDRVTSAIIFAPTTKRDLYQQMSAYALGIELGQDRQTSG